MKLSVRISDLDWERLRSERTKIRAILRVTLEHLSQDERRIIRKLIEDLLKGGEEPDEVYEADMKPVTSCSASAPSSSLLPSVDDDELNINPPTPCQ